MSHLLIYLFFVKEFKMNNQVFEIAVLTKVETIAPADLTTEQFALYTEAVENGYTDQHDNQHKNITMIGLLTVNGNTHVVAISEANKYGFSKLELLNGKAVQTTGSVGGKFDTTNGFQGMSDEDKLVIIMPTKTYAF